MSLPRLNDATHIADRLNELAAMVKTRSRASLTYANRLLETIATRFFNVLFGWDLVNLNTHQANYPAADLGDRARRIAIQVTNEDSSDKIRHTTTKAIEHQLGTDFDRLIVFFLLPKKPGFPKNFIQPPNGPKIETWDIADLLKQLQELPDLKALNKAAKVLDEEMGKIAAPETGPKCDISRIIKYAPAELIGREDELKLLNDAWAKVQAQEAKRPHLLTFVALGGEGKTSLVAKWAADLAHQDWPGCDAVFAWSFYSQGTREQTAVSSDVFLAEALIFFGDVVMAGSAQGAFDKGRRLAHLVGERRALLILDGLEPLQYAPTSPTPGELKDQGLAALLKGLAATSHGLCVVTTRYSIPDLRAYWQTTAPEVKLTRLSTDAGVVLLQSFGVMGSLRKVTPSADSHELLNEFEKLVEDVKGHALTLNLLGSYLRDAHDGDIRHRDLIKLEEADAEVQGGHAFRVMDAYVKSFENGGKTADDNAKGRRALALLQLLGLFDRPATVDCLNALWKGDAIAGLTEPLTGIIEAQRNISLKRLEDAKLLTVNREKGSGLLIALDAHPLLREYFARRVRQQQPEAWRAAHRRLYEHLCATTPDKPQPTLEDIQPLYQAVAHGCQAGMQQEVCDKVYVIRILHEEEYYTIRKLGAFGSDLGAISCFFELPWTRISSSLTGADQALLLSQAAVTLRAVGRLTEAVEPMRAGLENYLAQEHWEYAARCAGNLSELELTLGEVARAVADAEKSVTYADRSDGELEPLKNRTKLANALHQASRRVEAEARFHEAENLQAKPQPTCPLLSGTAGFRYCDLLLAAPERAAWRLRLDPSFILPSSLTESCRAISQRAVQTIKIAEHNIWLLEIALDHLTLGRTALYGAILGGEDGPLVRPMSPHCGDSALDGFAFARRELDAAVDGLRRAGQQQYLPLGLLTRAWLRSLTGACTGPESAQSDLDEAWEIAERGPMKLFQADIHLHRARLFFREKKYPWNKHPDGTPRGPKDDIAAAEKLIKD